MSIKKGVMYVFIANVINLIISLFTGFVLPKLLSIETYSSIKLFQLYITYIGILHFGFSDGMYLRHGGKGLDQIDKKDILSEYKTFKIFQFVVEIIAIIVSILTRNEMLLFCALVILPINIGNYIRNLYQAIGQFKRYSRFTNINTLLIFFINLFLLLIVKTDSYYVYIIAYIVAYIVYWLMLEIENRKLFGKEKVKANKKYLSLDIRSGFFLMVGSFCNVIFTSIDRIFVQNLLGQIKFAFYSFAVSIENLMNVFITPISTVMYNYLCNHNEREQVIKIKKILLLFAAGVVAVIFPAKFIINIWLTKYEESLGVLYMLFAAQYMSIVVRCMHVNLYKAEKKQNRYFAIMLGIVILSIVLNIIFFNIQNTIVMIAMATLVTNIVWFLIGEFDFKKYRLTIKEYSYTFIILILFLICVGTPSAITGFFAYLCGIIIISLILMRKECFYLVTEGKKILLKILKKGKLQN